MSDRGPTTSVTTDSRGDAIGTNLQGIRAGTCLAPHENVLSNNHTAHLSSEQASSKYAPPAEVLHPPWPGSHPAPAGPPQPCCCALQGKREDRDHSQLARLPLLLRCGQSAATVAVCTVWHGSLEVHGAMHACSCWCAGSATALVGKGVDSRRCTLCNARCKVT